MVLDKDSNPNTNKYVFNMTVSLKDSKPKVEGSGIATRSRKDEQAKQLADKLIRMSIAPLDMFRNETNTNGDNLYSVFDIDGVPTHDMHKEPLTKSNIKKLKKEWDKQKRLYESNKK